MQQNNPSKKGIPATAWFDSLSTAGRINVAELDRRIAIVQRLEAERNGGAK